jgi:prepilin-type N-terminal cleavage/methylation domain-containing protein
MRKAFTLIELVVALGILALVFSFAGVIFRVSIEAQRTAMASAEIMQKLRVITGQLDADLRALRKDGDIVVMWSAARRPGFTGPNPNAPSAFERFDRIMFFAGGDFQTYGANPVRRGNTARICYTLANRPTDNPAEPLRPPAQEPETRILARTQHILIPPANPKDRLDTGAFSDGDWRDWNNNGEHDNISLPAWQQIPLAQKVDMVSVIADVRIGIGSVSSEKYKVAGGVTLAPTQPASLHALLCEGVGQFMVQGWSDAQQRWIPQVNPNGDDSLEDDSDFFLEGANLHPEDIPGVWYPQGALLRGITRTGQMDLQHFNEVPGLGRALKFTFTLYDSKGLITNGRTFTHTVYLDN